MRLTPSRIERTLDIGAGEAHLHAELMLPAGATGLVVLAHAGRSSHRSSNRYVARALQRCGLGTLLVNLLAPAEAAADAYTGRYHANLMLLAERLVQVTRTLDADPMVRLLRLGYFAADIESAAALVAAGRLARRVSAVATRDGRPDLAAGHVERMTAAALFIVGNADPELLEANEEAYDGLAVPKQLIVVPGAAHPAEDPGALQEVAALAAEWFQRHLEAAVRA